MRAYHGKESLKKYYLRTALEHERADAYVKGLYWDPKEKRGCNIGCWTQSAIGGHGDLAHDMGVPEELLYLSDGLFEALPDPEYKTWSRRFAEAIMPGRDLTGAWARFLSCLLLSKPGGLIYLAETVEMENWIQAMGEHMGKRLGAWRHSKTEILYEAIQLRRAVIGWKSWEEQARPDNKAGRAALDIWDSPVEGSKGLERAAWYARAAWGGKPEVALAQSEALLAILC